VRHRVRPQRPLSRRPISLARVLAEAWRLGRERIGFLLAAGVAVFAPVGLVEAFELSQVQAGDIDVAGVIATAIVGVLFSAVTLIGEVLYSGIVAATVREAHGGRRRSVGELVRSLPYGRLIAADLLFVAVVGLGLLAFVVPGLVFLAWFSLAAPVIEVERRRLLDAFRRSRALVRRDFWRSLALVAGVTLAGEAVSLGIAGAVGAALGHSFLARWFEASLSDLLTAPLFALPIVVLYFELAEASTSSGTVRNR
jgi:hypothetical protein